jgi:hypothetical protein
MMDRRGGDRHDIHTGLDQRLHVGVSCASILLDHFRAAIGITIHHTDKFKTLYLGAKADMVASHPARADHAITKGSRG